MQFEFKTNLNNEKISEGCKKKETRALFEILVEIPNQICQEEMCIEWCTPI